MNVYLVKVQVVHVMHYVSNKLEVSSAFQFQVI